MANGRHLLALLAFAAALFFVVLRLNGFSVEDSALSAAVFPGLGIFALIVNLVDEACYQRTRRPRVSSSK